MSAAVDRISWDEAQRSPTGRPSSGERFGPLWATYWFRVRATVPEEWRGGRVDLLFVSRSEAALWRDGAHRAGPQHGRRRRAARRRCSRGAAEPGPLELQIELACNGMFGAQDAPAELKRCDIALFDPEAWRRYFDFETLRALEAETRDEAWSGLLARAAEPLLQRGRSGDPRPRSTSTTTASTRTSSRRSGMRTSTPRGSGRWPRPTARRCAASAPSSATWRTTRSTASPARRPSSTPGSRSATRSSGSGSARRSSAGSSCLSAAAGSSPTATCRRASRSCASSSTASAGSSASSAGATASSGAPTRSATPGSCRRSCARPASRAS